MLANVRGKAQGIIINTKLITPADYTILLSSRIGLGGLTKFRQAVALHSLSKFDNEQTFVLKPFGVKLVLNLHHSEY